MNTKNKIIYLAEGIERKKILKKIKDTVVGLAATAIGAAMLFSPQQANASGIVEKAKQAPQAIVRAYNDSKTSKDDFEYFEKELDKIQKKLDASNVPADALKDLDNEMKEYRSRISWNANFMSRRDRYELIIKKYNEKADKLIYQYSDKTVKDVAKRTGQKTKRIISILALPYTSNFKTINNILTVSRIKPYEGETRKEIIRRRAEAFAQLELSKSEKELYDLGLTEKDLEDLAVKIEEAYEEIAPKLIEKKEKISSILNIYKDNLIEKIKSINIAD